MIGFKATTYIQSISDKWRCGLMFRWGSVWVGAHWSPQNKRLCVNILPFVTFWITPPYGTAP